MLPNNVSELPCNAERVFSFNRNDNVQPFFPRCLHIRLKSKLVEFFLQQKSNFDAVFERCWRFRVDIEKDEIGFFSGVNTGQGHVNFKGCQISKPNQRIKVVDKYVVYVAFCGFRVKLDSLHPFRRSLRRIFPIKPLFLYTIRISGEHNCPPRKQTQNSWSNLDVILDNLPFRNLKFRKQNLVKIRKIYLSQPFTQANSPKQETHNN